jgi:pyrimidine-nucleoside phosphorylase
MTRRRPFCVRQGDSFVLLPKMITGSTIPSDGTPPSEPVRLEGASAGDESPAPARRWMGARRRGRLCSTGMVETVKSDMRPYDLIAKKRDGGEHTQHELQELARAVTDGVMPDYQVAAWLMAAFLRGMTPAETLALTLAMRDSGQRVDWGDVPGIKLDKHSSGGVGDKVTPVVVPLLAAAGVPMLKMSGRGLGFSGGTVDKLESIPGFRSDLSPEEASDQVKHIGAALVGQSPALVPADKKLYALRDVTATIESIPLIAASIMSKKLAGGADAVLLDVKVGRGAFMKTEARARELSRAMVEIGTGAGVRTVAALTSMDEPLGYTVGNALEIAEACALLTGKGRIDARFRELCMILAARGLVLAGKAGDDRAARSVLERLLAQGTAAAKFEAIIQAQGGDPRVVAEPARLPKAATVQPVRSEVEGYVKVIDAEQIGQLAVEIGAGRMRKEDAIDPAVGIVLMKKTGDRVIGGDVLAELHLNGDRRPPDLQERLTAAYTISQTEPAPIPLLYGFVE